MAPRGDVLNTAAGGKVLQIVVVRYAVPDLEFVFPVVKPLVFLPNPFALERDFVYRSKIRGTAATHFEAIINRRHQGVTVPPS